MARFDPGSIQLNLSRDIPLLRQVLHSIYATKQQLYEFMYLETREHSPQSFHNRLQRLVRHTMVKRHDGLPGFASTLYSIGQLGLDTLIAYGEPYAGRGCGLDCPPAKAQHAIALNDIHLALARSKTITGWIPESEICSRNILTSYGYAKDYDAVVMLRHRDAEITFALEYERSQKTDPEYREIAAALEREVQVDFILYLVTTRHLFSKVAELMRHTKRVIALGVACEFEHKLFDAEVSVMPDIYPQVRLLELLEKVSSGKQDHDGRYESIAVSLR
jgi:hypothetical protein